MDRTLRFIVFLIASIAIIILGGALVFFLFPVIMGGVFVFIAASALTGIFIFAAKSIYTLWVLAGEDDEKPLTKENTNFTLKQGKEVWK